ncbi:MAG: hypothetical protein ABR954_01230 [Dehalococcoidales bacterium]
MFPNKTRKIRICLFWKGNYYSFCWIELLKDGSFSLGFLSKVFKFTEYGTARLRDGYFSGHVKTLTSGNLNINDAKSPHVTFHTPHIEQNSGIVHMVAENGEIDQLELNWFPVRKVDTLLYAYSGNIAKLDRDKKKKSRYQIVNVPSDVQCLRMELMIYPRVPKYPKPPKIIHNPSAIANIHGGCPDYMLSCCFYKNAVVEPQFYFASE